MAYTASIAFDLLDPSSAEVEVDRRGVRSDFMAGMVQRRQTLSSEANNGQAAVRMFILTYALASRSTYERLMELWEESDGGAQGMSYRITDLVYSGTETIIVRFAETPLLLNTMNGVHFTFTVKLQEMLHSPGA